MVVSSLFFDATGVDPVLSRAKQPVPLVDLIMPGEKQACPMVAACWSPAMPQTAMAPPNRSGVQSPK
jgi:hypothetical protein